MPNSLLDPNSSAAVRSFLASAIPSAQLSQSDMATDQAPLLLMQTAHVAAAFAFANGDGKRSYDALYGSFKRHCAEQKGEWDRLDLAFVFCVHPDFPQLDHFCSRVETDVYFCRKFVVPLSVPVATSLSRLPFLPLLRIEGQSIRPPSAQTFLQQCGMPALLAKFVVVQHERSPEGIIEDCTSGKFGEARPLVMATSGPTVQADRPSTPIRLESVTIENFRAYRRPQSFELGADVTVLYGPNGFGKTSFFDAVDFAITGGIGRIEARRQADFSRTARHLDSKNEKSAVTLTFRGEGAARTITRQIDDRKQAQLDAHQSDRKGVLTALTGGRIPAADRVENFIDLFRASHLFSQEQQELTKDFADDCRLSAGIVSRMLAFEDYANAVAKATRVREVLQHSITEANDAVRLLAEQISLEKKEIERLGQFAKSHANVQALQSEIEALRQRLLAAGISTSRETITAATIRGWRASIESKHAQSRSNAERLGLIAKELSALPRMRTELTALQQQSTERERLLQMVGNTRGVTETEVQALERRAAELADIHMAEQKRLESFAWLRKNQPDFTRLIARKQELETTVRRQEDELQQLQAKEAAAVAALRSKEAQFAQLAEKIGVARQQRNAVQTFLEAVSRWQIDRARLTAIAQLEQKNAATVEMLRAEERELTPLVAAAGAEEGRLVQHIAEADKSQSELRGLISRLEGHVQTGFCPLCGDDHGSKEELLKSIGKHVARDAASGARADLTKVRERVRQLNEKVAANKRRQQAATQESMGLSTERERLGSDIAQFSAMASKLVIALEGAGRTPAEQGTAIHARLNQDLAELEELNRDAQAAITNDRTAVAVATAAVVQKKAGAEQSRAEIKRVQQDIDRVRTEAQTAKVALEMEPQEWAEFEEISRKRLEQAKADGVKLDAQGNLKKTELRTARQQTTALKEQLTALHAQAGQLQKNIGQITAKLEQAALPLDSTGERLLQLFTEQSRLQAELAALRDTASSLELAMDAATTAAALTTLQGTIRNRERQATEFVAKRDRCQPWLKYFDEVSRLVAAQQNDAIANFTQLYGPRTSVIQRRLRSVYGFDDIEMTSRDSSISVRVKRSGEALRPIDYFSQSQQQTLLLGLFLTACSSQTWSAFSPVFLDDPVTHFDDLNTYAFLDLLVGLIDSEPDARQFVISTCDEKLLQLARQKFRHFGERAKFYRFMAIGAEGPQVAEMS